MSRALLLVAAVVAAGVGVTALLVPRATGPAPPGPPDRGPASAFGRPDGFEVTVSDVRAPGAGGRVTMAVSLHSTSPTQQRAGPLDFSFRNGSGDSARPVFDAACPRWTRADPHPAGGAAQRPRDADTRQVGADLGPVPRCISVAHPDAAGPTPVWSPDFGLFGTPVAIPLR